MDPLSHKKRPKGRDRALVETATGKKYCPVILDYTWKLQRQRDGNEEKQINLHELEEHSEDSMTCTTPDTEEVDDEDEVLQMLERERRLLAEKSGEKEKL